MKPAVRRWGTVAGLVLLGTCVLIGGYAAVESRTRQKLARAEARWMQLFGGATGRSSPGTRRPSGSPGATLNECLDRISPAPALEADGAAWLDSLIRPGSPTAAPMPESLRLSVLGELDAALDELEALLLQRPVSPIDCEAVDFQAARRGIEYLLASAVALESDGRRAEAFRRSRAVTQLELALVRDGDPGCFAVGLLGIYKHARALQVMQQPCVFFRAWSPWISERQLLLAHHGDQVRRWSDWAAAGADPASPPVGWFLGDDRWSAVMQPHSDAVAPRLGLDRVLGPHWAAGLAEAIEVLTRQDEWLLSAGPDEYVAPRAAALATGVPRWRPEVRFFPSSLYRPSGWELVDAISYQQTLLARRCRSER